jgi:Gpi18-like mannosyltransferase
MGDPSVSDKNTRWNRDIRPLLSDILLPFVLTRLALLLIGWFSRQFPMNANYYNKQVIHRGWEITPIRWLDIWARYDTGWYLKIIREGYHLEGDLQARLSNIAYFPLYPYTVKALVWLLPGADQSSSWILLVGVLLSNLCLLGALILLYRLVCEQFEDAGIARRAVFYLLLFPTSFFFSAFYTESMFLFLSVAAFYAARKKSWAVAGLLGALLALTRLVGVFIFFALLWEYLASLRWEWRKIRLDVAWLLAIPLALLVYLASLYPITGDFFAPISVQAANGRAFASPWQTLFSDAAYSWYITPIERIFAIGIFALILVSFKTLPSPAYAIYALPVLLTPMMTGMLASTLRYEAVIFPIYITLGIFGKRAAIDQTIIIIFLTLQTLLMFLWCQFYWVA